MTIDRKRRRQELEQLRQQIIDAGVLPRILRNTRVLDTREIELTAADVQRLKVLLDADFRLLDKVLPSLKAMATEFSAPDGGPMEVVIKLKQ